MKRKRNAQGYFATDGSYKPSGLRMMVLDALEELGLPPSPDNVICLMKLSQDVLSYVSGVSVDKKERF